MSGSPIPSPPPDANATQRGLVNTATQSFAGLKTFQDGVSILIDSRPTAVRPNLNVLDFGADRTGVLDSSSAFAAAIAASATVLNPAGGVILVPPGNYLFNDNLNIDRSVTLTGEHGGYYGSSVLTFATSFGVIVHRATTSPDGGTGDMSVLRNLKIQTFDHVTVTDGILVKARCIIDQCRVLGFGGNGIAINANTGAIPPTNANVWALYDCLVSENGGHGVYAHGADANAGKCVGLDTEGNGGWGVFDDSFLGNTWIGCHSATNTLGGYATTAGPNVCNAVFLGCYSEGDEPASIINLPAAVFGGNLAQRLDPTAACSTIGRGIENPLAFLVKRSAGNAQVAIGSRNGTESIFTINVPFDSGTGVGEPLDLSFVYQNPTGYTNFFAWNFGGAGDKFGPLLAGSGAQIAAWPVSVAQGTQVFDKDHYLGSTRFGAGAAIPATGVWNVGDQRLSSSPDSTGIRGWISNSSGSAGTYTEGRTATADGSAVVVLSSTTSVLVVGDMILVGGTGPRRILNINGTAVTLSNTVPAGAGLAISYVPPAFSVEAFVRKQGNTAQATAFDGGYRGVIPAKDWIVDVAELGILPTNTGTQNSDAIDAALAAIPLRFGANPVGMRWQFGFGAYSFARTIQITRSMYLCGVTGMGFGGTKFLFPAGVTGIICHSDQSFGGIDGERSDWTVLQDLYLVAEGKTTTAHGIFIKGYGIRLENVAVLSFKGNGFNINASTASVPSTNANKWAMANCRSGYNDGHGLFVQGGDTNAGHCLALDTHDNGLWGIYEDSFLGNTYVACHSSTNGQLGSAPNTSGNDIGGYHSTGSVSFNTFIGCYSEGNEGPSIINAPAIIMGGLIPSGVTGDGVNINSGSCFPLIFLNSGGSKTGHVQIGSKDGSKSHLRFYSTEDGSGSTLAFKYGMGYGAFNEGWYGFNVADLNGQSGLMIAGDAAQLTSWPMAPLPGRAAFDDRGYYLDQNHVTNGEALPSVGTSNWGDEHKRTRPVAGGKRGWVCTASGTAGTYTEGRTAAADGTNVVVLSAASAVLRVGDLVEINASGRIRITAISGTSVSFGGAEPGDPAVTVPAGSGLTIAYVAPIWKEYGPIDA